MVLTDKEIRKMSSENLDKPLISDFDEHSLQSESYDLKIGKQVYVLKNDYMVIDLAGDVDESEVYETVNIGLDGYTLKPKQYILASVTEKITLPDNITAHIRPRTRLTRIGLIVSAQHCNSTYSGELKIGIYNASDFVIKIPKYQKIAQIVFEELKGKPSDEKLYINKKDAAYKNEKAFVGYKADEFNAAYDELIKNLMSDNYLENIRTKEIV